MKRKYIKINAHTHTLTRFVKKSMQIHVDYFSNVSWEFLYLIFNISIIFVFDASPIETMQLTWLMQLASKSILNDMYTIHAIASNWNPLIHCLSDAFSLFTLIGRLHCWLDQNRLFSEFLVLNCKENINLYYINISTDNVIFRFNRINIGQQKICTISNISIDFLRTLMTQTIENNIKYRKWQRKTNITDNFCLWF